MSFKGNYYRNLDALENISKLNLQLFTPFQCPQELNTLIPWWKRVLLPVLNLAIFGTTYLCQKTLQIMESCQLYSQRLLPTPVRGTKSSCPVRREQASSLVGIVSERKAQQVIFWSFISFVNKMFSTYSSDVHHQQNRFYFTQSVSVSEPSCMDNA